MLRTLRGDLSLVYKKICQCHPQKWVRNGPEMIPNKMRKEIDVIIVIKIPAEQLFLFTCRSQIRNQLLTGSTIKEKPYVILCQLQIRAARVKREPLLAWQPVLYSLAWE